MQKVTLVIFVFLFLVSCVKIDPPVTGRVLEFHEHRQTHPTEFYVKLDKNRAIEVTVGVFIAVDVGSNCTFYGTSASHPHRYSKVECEMPQ